MRNPTTRASSAHVHRRSWPRHRIRPRGAALVSKHAWSMSLSFLFAFLFRPLPLGFSGQARTPLWPPGCSRRSRARAAEGGNPVGPLLHTPLKAAPGGDSPLSGCPLQAGFTGVLVCPVKGVTPRAPLSPSRVAAISLRHQGGYPSPLWNGFIRSSLPSHSQPSTLKDTAVSKQVRTDPGLAKRVCPGVDTALQ